jgi:hypothetical protein
MRTLSWTLWVVAAASLFGAGGRLVAQPTNDLFADRVLLAGTNITIAGSNSGAGTEPGEDIGGGAIYWTQSVWYEWTAPTNGVMHVSISGGNSSFIPGVRMYRGAEVATLVAADVLADGSVPVTTGDILQIKVASLYYPVWSGGGGSGEFSLTLSLETPQPASNNDLFANRMTIGVNEFNFSGSLYGATAEAGEPLVSANATQTLWFSFSAPAPGQLTVIASSPQFTPSVAMYEGSTLNALTPVPSLSGTPLAFSVLANREYALQISSDWTPVGYVSLQTRYQSAANDYFTNRYQLSGTNVSIIGDNREASSEPDETLPLTGSAGRTLWYSWEAPVQGRVRISSGSCCMNRALAVYRGNSLVTLQRLVAGQDSLIFMAEAGTVYHIQVDTAGGNPAEFSLSISTTPATPPANDDFENAIWLVGALADNTAWIDDATMQLGEAAHRTDGPAKSLWWNWQAPINGNASVSALASLATNLTVAVYRGNSVDALTLVGKTTGGAVNFSAVGGETYRLAAAALQPTLGDVVMRAQISGGFSGTPTIIVPGNLLLEPSFEGTGLEFQHWQLSTPSFGGGYVGERGGADGTTWPALGGGVSMWQNIATVPGQNYAIKFAFRPDFGASVGRVKIWWGDQDLSTAETVGGHWNWTNLIATATTTLTQFKIEVLQGYLGVDGFSVVSAQAPPIIITQPVGVSTFAGGGATFLVGVSGSAPLTYRWYSPTGLLTEGSSRVLVLDDVTLADAGPYFAVVSNAFGVVTSAVASLVVEAPSSPTIVLQPYNQKVPAGGYVTLSVAAVGTPPLNYQWFWNGTELAGATNRQLIFPTFATTNAGTYTARVANDAQAVWSLPATLALDSDSVGGAALWFGNEIPDGGFFRKAPVFDADQETKLSGSDYVAQLYAGPDLPGLRPVSAPRVFRTGFNAGLIVPVAVELPNVSPAQPAFVQVRVWQSAKGVSYEEARALGGKFGKSEVLEIMPGIMPNPPPLWGLQSFSLQAGLPEFVAGRLDFVGSNPDGSLTWELTGNAGYRYVIEKSSGDANWNPFLVLTNFLGTVTFSDASTNATGVSIYRARILD